MDNICVICLEDVTKVKRLTLTTPCGHRFCKKCLATYARTQIQITNQVKCPITNCPQILDLNGLIGQKWIKLMNKQLKTNGCPKSRCQGILINGTCDQCQIRICRFCGEIEHLGRDCNPEIQSNYQRIQREAKPCLKCQVLISKNGGCDHMFCTKCKTHFWWSSQQLLIEHPVPPMIPTQHIARYEYIGGRVEYTMEKLRALGYEVGETQLIYPCLECSHQCSLNTGLCCACADKRGFHNTKTYIDGLGIVTNSDFKLHYCPQCR